MIRYPLRFDFVASIFVGQKSVRPKTRHYTLTSKPATGVHVTFMPLAWCLRLCLLVAAKACLYNTEVKPLQKTVASHNKG